MRFSVFSFFLCFVISASGFAATIYYWVDEDGNRHYSDEPRPGAQRMELDDPHTIPALPPQSDSKESAASKTSADAEYQSFSVLSPAVDEVVLTNLGNVEIKLNIQPSLMPEHRIQVILDGEEKGSYLTNQFSIEDVNPGTHQLTVQVREETNEVVVSSSTTFHLRRLGGAQPIPSPLRAP
ncbi:MAG: DUF4124 domain-containing protein [Pseudomonadota bacterium]|nr:DUF4124 domain-containing protein [Pseudomonadota bacterium]